MTIPFSGPGVYLTVGGFLVELHKDRRAQKEFSPGVNVFGQTIHEVDFGHGWSWNEDGTVSLYGPWSAKLRLSQKLALQLIPAPPHGFKYAGGYPMFRTIKQNEYGMLLNGAIYKHIPAIPDTESSGNYIPLEKIEDTPKNIVDGPGVYETQGGFLVELDKSLTSVTPIPGKKTNGIWQPNGSIYGMNPEWTEKLRIIDKVYADHIPTPPEGYQYAGGYPQYRFIAPNEWCMSSVTGLLDRNTGSRRTITKNIPLSKLEYYECDNPDPSYVVRKGDQFFWANEWVDTDKCVGMTVENAFRPILKMRSLSPFPQKKEIWYIVTNPDYVLSEGDQYQNIDDGERWFSIINSIGKTRQQAKLDGPRWKCRSKNKEACLSSAPKEIPYTNFNFDLTATLVKPSLLKRSFNYWVIEPAANAFRYAVITAVLWGGVEIYKNPAVVWKVLPKISVTIK